MVSLLPLSVALLSLFVSAAEASPWQLFHERRVAEANHGFSQAMELQNNGGLPPQTALDYSRFLKSQGRPQEAAVALRQGLAATERLYGPDHPLILPILLELAELYEGNPPPDSENPLPLLERALHLAQMVYGEKSRWIPRILEAMVPLILSKNGGDTKDTLPQAIALQEQALALLDVAMGSDDRTLPPLLARLGEMEQQAGREAVAVGVWERALKISVEQQGPFHLLRIRLLHKLGNYFLEKKQPQRAVTYFLPALAIAETVRDSEHFTLVPLFNQLARCYREMGLPSEAAPYLTRALSLTEKRFGDLNLETAHLVAAMAGNLRMEGNNAQAMALYQKALSVVQQQPIAFHLETASLQIALAKVMADEGMGMAGEPFFRQGVVALVAVLGAGDPKTVGEREGYGLFVQRLDLLNQTRDMLTDRELIQEIQERLLAVGFDPGKSDGRPRQQTKLALKMFFNQMGLPLGTATYRENLLEILHFLPPVAQPDC